MTLNQLNLVKTMLSDYGYEVGLVVKSTSEGLLLVVFDTRRKREIGKILPDNLSNEYIETGLVGYLRDTIESDISAGHMDWVVSKESK